MYILYNLVVNENIMQRFESKVPDIFNLADSNTYHQSSLPIYILSTWNRPLIENEISLLIKHTYWIMAKKPYQCLKYLFINNQSL